MVVPTAALICDDISWQLSKRGDPSQYALAERCLGYMRSHKKGSMDIYIGQQQIYGIPPQLRKLISTWFIQELARSLQPGAKKFT